MWQNPQVMKVNWTHFFTCTIGKVSHVMRYFITYNTWQDGNEREKEEEKKWRKKMEEKNKHWFSWMSFFFPDGIKEKVLLIKIYWITSYFSLWLFCVWNYVLNFFLIYFYPLIENKIKEKTKNNYIYLSYLFILITIYSRGSVFCLFSVYLSIGTSTSLFTYLLKGNCQV